MVWRGIRLLGVWLVCGLVLPLVLLGTLEGGLRLVGYGKSTRPFIHTRVDGHAVSIRNVASVEQFLSWRLQLSEWEDIEQVVVDEKPADTYRIFVVGESTPEGWPGPQFSFARFLRVMLEERFPEVHFEVCNLAFRAVNSHVMRVQAAAAAELRPDLFVVYLGNNEVHGPFGATRTPEGPQPLPSMASIRATIWLSDYRIFQIARWARSRIRHPLAENVQSRWHSRDLVYWDDPRIPTILDRYAHNLRDICEFGVDAGAAVFLCTVPANLRHWRPVGSIHPPEFSASDEARWTEFYEAGQAQQDVRAYDRALQAYEHAESLDSTHADLQFRMGQCLWNLARFDEACGHFRQALEYDAYPWVRSRAKINEIIAETGLAMAGRGVRLVDVKAAIELQALHGCPGVDLFFDYCHLNLRGAYLMAATLFQDIAPEVATRKLIDGRPGASPLTQEECMRRLGLHSDLLSGYLQQTVDSSDPLDDEAKASLRLEVDEARRIASQETYDTVAARFREALEYCPDDYLLRYRYVRFLLPSPRMEVSPDSPSKPVLPLALEEARALALHHPYRRGSLRLLGEAQARSGDLEGALKTVEKLLRLYPRDVTAYGDCALVLLAMDRTEDAWSAIAQAPDEVGGLGDMEVLNQRKAAVRLALGDLEGAAEYVAKIITLPSPDLPAQYERLAELLADRPERLVRVLTAVLETQRIKAQDQERTHFFLGRTHLLLGDVSAALDAFRNAAKDHALKAGILEELLGGARRAEEADDRREALALYREVRVCDPDNPAAAAAEERLKQTDESGS